MDVLISRENEKLFVLNKYYLLVEIRPEINFSRQIFITGNTDNMCILWTIYHRNLKPKNEC